jgi:hypothetical protein
MIGLDDPQDRDHPKKHNFDSQRLLNRVRKTPHDRGSYFLSALFILVVLAAGILQFTLRAGSSFVSGALDLPGVGGGQIGQNVPAAANSFFVLIFFLTQGLALYLGYTYGFLGKDSLRAYGIIGGANSHRDYQNEFNRRVKRADESLSSLLNGFKRYPGIAPDKSTYLQRVAALGVAPETQAPESGRPPPKKPGGAASNVTPLSEAKRDGSS